MRAGQDVGGHEFADFASGLGAGVHGGFHARDVATANHRDEAAADGDA